MVPLFFAEYQTSRELLYTIGIGLNFGENPSLDGARKE
jgi:hypothetical protein